MSTPIALQLGYPVFDAVKTLAIANGITPRVAKAGNNQESDMERALRWLTSGQYLLRYATIGLSDSTLFDWIIPQQINTARQVLNIVKQAQHAIYVPETALKGRFLTFDDPNYDWIRVRCLKSFRDAGETSATFDDIRNAGAAFLANFVNEGFNVKPYAFHDEALVMALHDAREAFEGVVFEVYVGNERVLADEFEKFMALFVKYLTRLKKYDVEQEAVRSPFSVIYRLKSKVLSTEAMSNALEDFKEFMNLVEQSPAVVSDALLASGLPADEVTRILDAFHWEWVHLKLDVERDIKQKLVNYEHKVKNAVLEARRSHALSMMQVAASTNPLAIMPGIVQITNIINADQIGGQQMKIGKVNAHGQSIFADHITSSVFGLNYRPEDQDLLNAIEEHAPEKEKQRLQNDLERLNDKQLPSDQKLPAKKRLEAFAHKYLRPIGDIGFQAVLKLLEKKLNNLVD